MIINGIALKTPSNKKLNITRNALITQPRHPNRINAITAVMIITIKLNISGTEIQFGHSCCNHTPYKPLQVSHAQTEQTCGYQLERYRS